MSSYVPAVLRRAVFERAAGLCEYRLIHDEDSSIGCQVEHVISEKHGGPTSAENLALAWVFCNRFKGSDIATLVPGTNDLTRLFNPRVGRWRDHFRLDDRCVEGVTPVGRATALLLCFNRRNRLAERDALVRDGLYPSPAARAVMGPD